MCGPRPATVFPPMYRPSTRRLQGALRGVPPKQTSVKCPRRGEIGAPHVNPRRDPVLVALETP